MALKYRPKTFSDVIGQETAISILKSLIKLKRFESAYIFFGPSGVGKTTIGRIFANAILCDNPTEEGDPCGTCTSCRDFQEEKHFGYKELDAASYGGKEDMVNLRDDAAFQAVNKKKIILIDECHDISKQGQDALLKQVEECPEHLIYLFCTTEPDKMAETLRKRCMSFQLSRVSADLIVERLNKICDAEALSFEEEALSNVVYYTEGRVRDAISVLEETSYLGSVTEENFNRVSMNHDEEVCAMLCALGRDLNEAIVHCRKVAACISMRELYGATISLLNDAAALLYGREDYPRQRKSLLVRLKDTHGYSILEFLRYLIERDKYIDQLGLESDIIILHYKFCANRFKPQLPEAPSQISPEQKEEPIKSDSTSSVLSHAQLSKMSLTERNKFLREQRWNHKEDVSKKEPQRVPAQWSLPKEEKLGSDSEDDLDLDPLEFSRGLRGGRGGAKV